MNKMRVLAICMLVLGNTFSQEEPTPTEPEVIIKRIYEPHSDPRQIEPPVIPTPKAQLEDSTTIADFPDVEPSYIGGAAQLKKFIEEHLQYPKGAMENGDQGRVYVLFVVERDGTITNIELARKGYENESLENEALRLISIMPAWNPGEVKGKPVRARYRLPITFTLNEAESDQPNKKRSSR